VYPVQPVGKPPKKTVLTRIVPAAISSQKLTAPMPEKDIRLAPIIRRNEVARLRSRGAWVYGLAGRPEGPFDFWLGGRRVWGSVGERRKSDRLWCDQGRGLWPPPHPESSRVDAVNRADEQGAHSEVNDMRSFIPFNRLLLVGIVAAAAALSLVQVAQAGPPAPVVPGAIAVPDGNKVFLVGHGVGVQIYSCNGVVWGFVAPRANLYANNGKLIITHFAGPTWQAKDGSTVVGLAEASITVDPTAIPWLRLSAVSTAAGPDGDRLVDTTFVQRIATTGGLAPPAAECNATTAGTVAEVPYTADYYFWKRTGG
jgi:Protein of unknown function (DUF3455)